MNLLVRDALRKIAGDRDYSTSSLYSNSPYPTRREVNEYMKIQERRLANEFDWREGELGVDYVGPNRYASELYLRKHPEELRKLRRHLAGASPVPELDAAYARLPYSNPALTNAHSLNRAPESNPYYLHPRTLRTRLNTITRKRNVDGLKKILGPAGAQQYEQGLKKALSMPEK